MSIYYTWLPSDLFIRSYLELFKLALRCSLKGTPTLYGVTNQSVLLVLSDYHSDETELHSLRNKLFNELKALEEFPIASGSELKKRKHTKAGEGVAMKLCMDTYILSTVFDGAPFEDLNDLRSSSKLASQNQSICGDSALDIVCVCVFGFNVAFNNFSVISRRCLVATGRSMLTFIVLPHWSIMSQTLDMIPHPVTLSWHWVDQS